MNDHLTTRAASEEYGLSDSHIRRLLGEGKVEGRKVGHYWVVDRDSLERYLDGDGSDVQPEDEDESLSSSQTSHSAFDLPDANDYGFPD